MKKTHHDYWKTFYELLVKNYLEATFEPDFFELHKNEKPDFKSDEVGLEIVTAASETQNVMNSLLRKYMGKKLDEIPEGLLNSLEFNKNNMYQDKSKKPIFYIPSKQNGSLFLLQNLNGDLQLTGQIGFVPSDDVNSSMIVSKINEKIEKFNDHYEVFSRNIVGVYLGMPIIPESIDYQRDIALNMQEHISKELLEKLGSSKKKVFDIFYICFPDIVYKYTVGTGSFEYQILDNNKIAEIINKTDDEIKII